MRKKGGREGRGRRGKMGVGEGGGGRGCRWKDVEVWFATLLSVWRLEDQWLGWLPNPSFK